ncbi:MAG: bifunctional glutamate N-acetyltransferase/amino-acid acetyltransferase ArgJ, partial [Bacteroidales bacterium]|nr:bifunctional glutamate N-acetyltransferase/amino-acid acetyltransferase ArgJ [Bacteroidales bacterium]
MGERSMTNPTITAPLGFLAAGISCGIKQSGKSDLGLIVCPQGATAAAVLTTNKVFAAPVAVCREHLKTERIRAVVVNSGNANACTGTKGLNHARAMCRETAKRINAKAQDVLVASTGIIGEHLPMNKVKQGIELASQQLYATKKGGGAFARAIMTTDTKPKQAVREVTISGQTVTLAGAIKGAGMIAPNMATTLCFLTTDVVISKSLLQRALGDAIGHSVNRLTVDGHQSTNDTAILLASGQAGHRPITKSCPRYRQFVKTLTELCDDLAQQMALDAEGATRMFKVVVKGAANTTEAMRAARAVADYPLVKCAVHGGDPNWGRIICAVGSCDVKLDVQKLTCQLDELTV